MLRSALVADKGAIRREHEQRLPHAGAARSKCQCLQLHTKLGRCDQRTSLCPFIRKLERRFHLGHAPLRAGGDQYAGSGALVLRCARGIARALLDRAGIIATALRARTIALALRST